MLGARPGGRWRPAEGARDAHRPSPSPPRTAHKVARDRRDPRAARHRGPHAGRPARGGRGRCHVRGQRTPEGARRPRAPGRAPRSPTTRASSVAALGGEPGVHSARYAGPGADAARTTTRCWSSGSRRSGVVDPAAAFVCHVVVAAPDGRVVAEAEGRVEGVIRWPAPAAAGFGYDPLFHHPPSGCRFAELARRGEERREPPRTGAAGAGAPPRRRLTRPRVGRPSALQSRRCPRRPRPHPQLRHRRPHRPREVHAGGPDPRGHRPRAARGRRTAGPRRPGPRARARHHDQGPGRPDAAT